MDSIGIYKAERVGYGALMNIEDEAKDVTLWLIASAFALAGARGLAVGVLGGAIGYAVDDSFTGILGALLGAFAGLSFSLRWAARSALEMSAGYSEEEAPA